MTTIRPPDYHQRVIQKSLRNLNKSFRASDPSTPCAE